MVSRRVGYISNYGGDEHVGMLKKGPWTSAEDAVLLEYVKREGEGNWNAVQRNSGLQRCGKSCRLRWANHLRPFLKKGPFTPDEENAIIELHAKMGNKWARMAAEVPGRTDNEIKNYWNTRLKRRQRSGLPVYPVEVLQQQYNNQPPPPISHVPPRAASSFASIISAAIAATSSSRQTQHLSGQIQNYAPLDLQNFTAYDNNMSHTNSSNYIPRVNNNSLIMNQDFSSQNGPLFQPLSEKPLLFDFSIGLNTGTVEPISDTTNTMRANPLVQAGLFTIPTNNTELSSIQNRPLATKVQNSNSGYTGNTNQLMGGASSVDGDYHDYITARGSSGLLGDLLEESQAIKRGDKNKIDGEDNYGLFTGLINPNHEVFSGVSISANSNIGVKGKAVMEAADDTNVMDEDLLRFLDCPSPVGIPDWCEIGSTSNASNFISSTEPSNVTSTTQYHLIHNPKQAEEEDNDDDWDQTFWGWNNIPRVLS